VSSLHHQGDAGGNGLDAAVLAALFSQAPAGLHVLDTELRLVRVNTAASLMRDFPADRLVGRPLLEVLHTLDIAGAGFVEQAVRGVLETGEPLEDLRMNLRSRRDPRFEAVVSAACFRLQDRGGTVLGVVAVITDITARAKAEARLRLLNRAATSVGTTLDIFRTADELCELAVEELADCTAVDVIDSVLRGEAPAAVTATGTVPVRDIACCCAADGAPQGLPAAGEVGAHVFGTPYQQALADLAPVLVRHLDADSDWLEPLRKRGADLLAAGVHSMMVVPMRARGVVLGLACLYRRRNPTPYERDDLAFAEQLMSRAALCLDNARVYGRERTMARILKRDLGHPKSPVSSAVETAHAYLPTGAGGAWLDVLPLSGGRVGLAVGDATGQLVNAAASMGQLRAAVAALSDLDLPPDEILERLHDLASRPGHEPGGTAGGGTSDHDWSATCLYAAYDPVTRLCTIAGAGHPPPVLIHTDGQVEVIDLPTYPPLGKGIARYTVVERALPEGSTLFLYNRALARDGPDHPRLLLERLHRVTTAAHSSLQDMCDASVDALVPSQPQQDTVILLARVHTLDAARTVHWKLPNAPEIVSRARRLTVAQLDEWKLHDLAEGTALIVSELVTNAVRHTAQGPIGLRLIRDRALICEVTDGDSTAPHLRRAADTDEGGRGLYITAQLTDRWGVRPAPRGKTIWAEQALPSPGRPN
jgi:PAS domain S-box-containing protein